MSVIVRLESLTKEYVEGEKTRTILCAADAEFNAGEFVAIRGRSGSGKSTLLNIVAGIDSPTDGCVQIAAGGSGPTIFVNLTRLRPNARTIFRRDNIGFVFQFFNLIPTLTVLENVLLPAELAGGPADGRLGGALELLERVGLADRRDVFPDRLSGGEQQRVAIARALVRNPRLVLADEPTGNLDDATGGTVMALLSEMTHQAGKSLIMVTHSRKMAALADKVLTIEAGKIVSTPAGEA
jgi:putative ABC transport system ATP-binding protein